MELAHAEAIVRYASVTMAQPGSRTSFQNFHAMTGYDSECRVLLTNWCKDYTDVIDEIHILVGSRLVAMGVSAASLALLLVGIRLTTHKDPAVFAARTKEHLDALEEEND